MKSSRDENADLTLSVTANKLAIGEIQRLICPYCGGGSSGEVSLRMVRAGQDVTFWRCYRDKCGEHGTVQGGAATKVQRPIQGSSRTVHPLTAPTELLPPRVVKVIEHRYKILPTTISRNHWKWIPARTGLVMPVRNWWGFTIGDQVKALEGVGRPISGPKTVSYPSDSNALWLHFPVGMQWRGGAVWLVEDVISATRIAQAGADAVALMGTYLSQEGAQHLHRLGKRRIFVALDPDTWSKPCPTAVTLASKIALFFDLVRPVHITKDPKDMGHNELTDVLALAYDKGRTQ